jgi:hypothetical protein
MRDLGGGPTGVKTRSSSVSWIPGTESDGPSMNQSRTNRSAPAMSARASKTVSAWPMPCPSK